MKDTEKKISVVLLELGDAELEAMRLAEKYRLKENPKQNRRLGVILLSISALLGVYANTILERSMDVGLNGHGPINHGAYHLGFAPGAEFFIIICFTGIGLWLIFHKD